MLAYPSRRRFDLRGAEVIGECFAVSHRDPDRWGKKTGSWVPLSESAYAGREAKRWAQILILGPRAHDDSNVRHLEDRFRAMCARERISVLDEDPDSPGTGEVVGRVAS